MAEWMGSPVFHTLWSYVLAFQLKGTLNLITMPERTDPVSNMFKEVTADMEKI